MCLYPEIHLALNLFSSMYSTVNRLCQWLILEGKSKRKYFLPSILSWLVFCACFRTVLLQAEWTMVGQFRSMLVRFFNCWAPKNNWPPDIILLIDIWLGGKYFYVSLDGDNSCIHGSNVGMLQWSILVMTYKQHLTCLQVYNDKKLSHKWLSFFFNQIFNNRALAANFTDNSNFKIGKNIVENRFFILNNKISYDSLNLKYTTFKIHCKKWCKLM